ncbi:MAG TPA: 5-(carboxyamino)imidazole ribonucleotide synthase [Polyangiaceae bacterium]|nr:5-(carboxyamino)imidazole ribonucleotide synthase [Polyangiaceae bacterium]
MNDRKAISAVMGARVGVLGAGQLGRMLGIAGRSLGLELDFLDPTPGSPAAAVGALHVGEYTDESSLARLAGADVVTFEFENVPVAAVKSLEARVKVAPGSAALEVAQDRLHEKTCFRSLGIATPPFEAVSSWPELSAALSRIGLPAVLKTRRFGYDGKGQAVLRSEAEAKAAFEQLGAAPLILEGFVRFQRELSIIAVRSASGETACYPLVQNHHASGILRKTVAPAPDVSDASKQAATQYIEKLLAELDYVGVLALELFEVDGQLLANEIAPRVHNTGHWTIEGAVTSQFENHLRAILGLPLGITDAISPCAMLNLIGAAPDARAVLAVPDAHLHWYGKAPRPGRKVGHITVRAPDAATLAQRVSELERVVEASAG